jgi:phage gp46-like protein
MSTFSDSVDEILSAVDDADTINNIFGVDLTEALTGADDADTIGTIFGPNVIEALNAADFMVGGYGVSLTESLSADSTQSWSYIPLPAILEHANAFEFVSVAPSIFNASITETANSDDLMLASFFIPMSDALTADDTIDGTAIYNIAEAASATTSLSAIVTFVSQILEPALADDQMGRWIFSFRPATAAAFVGKWQTNHDFPLQPPDTDIAQEWIADYEGSDFQILSPTLESHKDLQTSVIVSLFTDRLALPTDELPDLPIPGRLPNRRGWWGDTYLVQDPDVNQIIRSRLWLLSRAKSTPALLQTAQQYVQESLEWLTRLHIATAVNVQTFFFNNDPSRLGIIVEVTRHGKVIPLKFSYAWNQILAQ